MRLRRSPTPEALDPDLETDLLIGPGASGVHHSEAELCAAWEAHGHELVRRESEDDPGWRPWAWWRFVAERPEYLKPPSWDDPNSGAKEDDCRAEAIGFLAARGDLTRRERATLRREGIEAQERIDTNEEQSTTGRGEPHDGDRAAAKVLAAIDRALEGMR